MSPQTKSRNRRVEQEKFSVFPPLGSKCQISFHATLESARQAAFVVAAKSTGEKTTIVERTKSGYKDVGYYDYCGVWHEESSDAA